MVTPPNVGFDEESTKQTLQKRTRFTVSSNENSTILFSILFTYFSNISKLKKHMKSTYPKHTK